MIPRLLERLDKAHQQFSWTELCHRLIPCATLLRWKARFKAGEVVVQKAGPKKLAPPNRKLLETQIQNLPHGRRRTAGTTVLYEQWSDWISRRDLQEQVAQERQNQIDDMKRVQWLKPGVAWSIDTTEYAQMKITPLRDMSSKYQVPTPLVQPTEDGATIAQYLDLMFTQQGPPLFLKRDLGSPLNCGAVEEVLERHSVLPLNSPPGYPPYNGSIERGMRDLKAVLNQQRLDALRKNTPMSIEVELATHKLNHRRLRSLGGLTPCQVYHDPSRRLQLHGTTRKRICREIFGQYWQIAQCMPETNRHNLNAAWRYVVENWLRRQNWIDVRTNNQQKNVSTNSDNFFSHN